MNLQLQIQPHSDLSLGDSICRSFFTNAKTNLSLGTAICAGGLASIKRFTIDELAPAFSCITPAVFDNPDIADTLATQAQSSALAINLLANREGRISNYCCWPALVANALGSTRTPTPMVADNETLRR
jgi:hypothetical protein